MVWAVVELHQLLRTGSEHSISSPHLIAEFDLEYVWREPLDNRAHLTPFQFLGGNIFDQSNHR